MNIIHLITNKVWGGGERYALDLCLALQTGGHNTIALTRHRHAVAAPFIDAGIHCGYIGRGGPFDIMSPIKLRRMLDRIEGHTVIHVHNFKDAATAINARRLCKNPHQVRVVCTRHLVKPAKNDVSHLRLYAALDAIVFVSKQAFERFRSTLPQGFDTGHMHVVHNAIMATPTAHKPHNDNSFRLIYAGRIAHEKGIDTLLNALKQLDSRKWQLEICGTGSARYVSELSRLADTLGIADHISWPGQVTDIYSHMAKADALVLPSRVPESFGLVILEAFSQGLPVITTDNGAQSEIVKHGETGMLVTPDAPDELASAIERYMTDRVLLQNNSQNAITTYSSQYNYNHFYEKILQIYNGC